MNHGKRPPLDEQKSLFEATVATEGVTTSAGEGTGLSLVDAGLAGAGANSFVSMIAIIHPGDPQNVDSKDITAFNDGTGEVTVASAFKGGQVAVGVPYKIVTFRFVPAEVAALQATCNAIKTLVDILNLTTFKQETVIATDVNGITWKDLLDKSTIAKPTKICGFKVTVAGTWAGKAKIRITNGAGTKIFPFQDEYVQDTEFISGTQVIFNFPVVVPVADGYKFQFRSSDAGDGAGETLQLNNLDVIEIG